MWATASSPDGARSLRRVLIPGWAVFATINLWLMFVVPGGETIPFHLVWFSLALVYGLAPWRLRTMVTALVVVAISTAGALIHHAQAGYIRVEEVSEVPLMTAIFLAMVWHVRRRQDALHEVERLAAVDRARAEDAQMFVRLVSHEMRTPITVARGYTELVRTAHPDPQTDEDTAIVLDELTKLDRSTQRLVTLIASDPPTVGELVDVDQLLERAAHRWLPAAPRQWHVAAAAGTAMLDGERLETALDCLLENALKFTAEGDAIEVHGRREDAAVVIEIVDSGAGIPADDLPYVFDTFYRGADYRGDGDAEVGTGLGLSIVRRIVEAWGGTATVTSTPGAGTRFTLRLPAAWPRPTAPHPIPARPGLPRAAGAPSAGPQPAAPGHSAQPAGRPATTTSTHRR
jgi:signal transduction histidine kinase